MKSFRASSVLLLLLLGNTLAWDGCDYANGWRCGDTCIDGDLTECNCGGTIFNKEAGMWCCHDSPCTGKGRFNDYYKFWTGDEDEEGRTIGADCTGTALNLTQPCNQTCNYYEEDDFRNQDGVYRSYVPCDVDNLTITQCIPETEVRDGKFDCRNRADELPFLTGIGNSSSLLLDLDSILTSCIDDEGDHGFHCSGYTWDSNNCVRLSGWCNPSSPYTCDELSGKTATGKTIDPQMCANQTFWEKHGCNSKWSFRCTGSRPGHCWQEDGWHWLLDIGLMCIDGSSEVKPPSKEEEGDCGEKLLCTARAGRWAGEKVCLEKRYHIIFKSINKYIDNNLIYHLVNFYLAND